MKNFKITYLLVISLFGLFLITSCDNEDDPIETINGFNYNNTFFATTNAYFEIDDEDNNGDGYPDHYGFFFSDGPIYDNDAGINGTADEYLMSVNNTRLVMYDLEITPNPSLASLPPQAGNTYSGGHYATTQILLDFAVASFNPSFFDNGNEFGQVVSLASHHNYGTIDPTITVNAINIDIANPGANSMDVDYSFTNLNGELITGHYEGPMGLIFD